MMRLRPHLPFIGFICSIVLAGPGLAQDEGLGAYRWSVQYLIDQSQTVGGESQEVFPRHNRGLAISPDHRYLYAGYHHTEDGFGEIRRIDLRQEDYSAATVRVLRGFLGKAIATDPDGRVYVSGEGMVSVLDANLREEQYRIDTNRCEGLAAVREGRELVLYGSERDEGIVKRWVLKVTDGVVVGADLAGFDGDGVVEIQDAVSLRGIAVDSNGRVLVADLEGDRVSRIDRDGTVTSVEIKTPMAIACDGPRAFVTRWREREISILDDQLAVVGTLGVPWEELQLAPVGNNRNGALSGIVAVHGTGLYVSNERGQTANQKSTYGRADRFSAVIEGKLYLDARADDNDPILFAQPVETAEAEAESAPVQ